MTALDVEVGCHMMTIIERRPTPPAWVPVAQLRWDGDRLRFSLWCRDHRHEWRPHPYASNQRHVHAHLVEIADDEAGVF